MEIGILAVGRLRPEFRSACDDYRRRLGRFVTFSEHEVKEASRAEGRRQLALEAERLLRRIPRGTTIVALSREGTQYTSTGVARLLERWRLRGNSTYFIIGGSRGLAGDVVAEAAIRWSLGSLTLPHELARVVVYEQIYRGFTILHSMPYHKGR